MRFHLPDSAARVQRRRDDDRGGLVRDCSLAIASGGVLAATAFARHWALQLPAVVAMAAVFWLLRTVPARRAYAVGASFTLAWLVPTTYWYYNFMSLGAAFGASVGWALLMANLFQLTALRKRFGTRLVWPLFALLWLALTWLRMRMPVTEDWWLPHLGYSVWRNSGLVRLGGFGGETVLEAVVLAGGMAVAAAFARRVDSTSRATGFSQKIGTPSRAASQRRPAWVSVGVARTSPSRSSEASMPSGERTSAPCSSATRRARQEAGSATTNLPAFFARMPACMAPMRPAPRRPIVFPDMVCSFPRGSMHRNRAVRQPVGALSTARIRRIGAAFPDSPHRHAFSQNFDERQKGYAPQPTVRRRRPAPVNL